MRYCTKQPLVGQHPQLQPVQERFKRRSRIKKNQVVGNLCDFQKIPNRRSRGNMKAQKLLLSEQGGPTGQIVNTNAQFLSEKQPKSG